MFIEKTNTAELAYFINHTLPLNASNCIDELPIYELLEQSSTFCKTIHLLLGAENYFQEPTYFERAASYGQLLSDLWLKNNSISNCAYEGGRAGAAYALLCLALKTENQEFLKQSEQILLPYVQEFGQNEFTPDNLYEGKAGALLILLYLYQISDNEFIVAQINSYTSLLLQNICINDDNEYYWKDNYETGIRLGSRGIAFALHELYVLTQNEELLQIITDIVRDKRGDVDKEKNEIAHPIIQTVIAKQEALFLKESKLIKRIRAYLRQQNPISFPLWLAPAEDTQQVDFFDINLSEDNIREDELEYYYHYLISNTPSANFYDIPVFPIAKIKKSIDKTIVPNIINAFIQNKFKGTIRLLNYLDKDLLSKLFLACQSDNYLNIPEFLEKNKSNLSGHKEQILELWRLEKKLYATKDGYREHQDSKYFQQIIQFQKTKDLLNRPDEDILRQIYLIDESVAIHNMTADWMNFLFHITPPQEILQEKGHFSLAIKTYFLLNKKDIEILPLKGFTALLLNFQEATSPIDIIESVLENKELTKINSPDFIKSHIIEKIKYFINAGWIIPFS